MKTLVVSLVVAMLVVACLVVGDTRDTRAPTAGRNLGSPGFVAQVADLRVLWPVSSSFRCPISTPFFQSTATSNARSASQQH